MICISVCDSAKGKALINRRDGFYVVLVVYVNMRYDNSYFYGYCRKNDVETLSQTYKQHSGIQNNSLNEKYGYMEICSRLLRKTLVENRMDNDYTICFDTYSVIP